MKFVSVKTIMDRITRHPLLQEIPMETVVDYAVDFIRIVGTPPSFLEKVETIDIHKYRGELPCDFYEMIQVKLKKDDSCDRVEPRDKFFRYSTDTFHMRGSNKDSYDLTYKIQGNCIFTSPLEEGQIDISYMAIPVDEDGLPLLPDNSIYLRALELYVKKQWFTIQFDLGKINGQIMQKADQDYAWAVGQAQTDLIRPTIDQMEAISNLWNTLIVRADEHKRGYVNTGTKERLIPH